MVYGHGCHMDAWRIKNASAPGSQRFRPGISVFRYDPVKPASDHPYADSIQKEQHHRSYACLGWIALANFAACSVLAVTKKQIIWKRFPLGSCSLHLHLSLYLYIFSIYTGRAE